MPTYDYICPDGHTCELHVPHDDRIVYHCERCGQPLTRQPSAPAFHLKGTGWDKQPPKEPTV